MARAKMAFESQTYPVWVGNLKETVSGKDLKSIFSQHGQIASCKVMENSMGNSRCTIITIQIMFVLCVPGHRILIAC